MRGGPCDLMTPSVPSAFFSVFNFAALRSSYRACLQRAYCSYVMYRDGKSYQEVHGVMYVIYDRTAVVFCVFGIFGPSLQGDELA
jgi:hypothetical protein